MIKRELAIFLVVGSLTVLLDFVVYRGLIWTGLTGVDPAKAAGFLTGTVFAYFANRFWTFGHKSHAKGSVWRFAFLYAATLSANVYVNAWALTWFSDLADALACFSLKEGAMVLRLLSNHAIVVQVAFLLATGVSACMNFLGMKMFVFKSRVIS